MTPSSPVAPRAARPTSDFGRRERPFGTVLSIVIPCHDAEGYVGQTIASALEQSRAPDEIIVVDDGSTDGSLDVARALAAAHPDRIRLFSERSGNAARTRNLGASVATGDMIMFLDADDVLGPGTLEALTAALDTAPTGLAICPWHRLELSDDRWVRRPASCRPRRRGEDALTGWLTGWYHPPCAVLWSRDAFERAGGWEERFCPNDDGDLVMRALAHGVPLVETDAGGSYYRRLPEGQASLSGRRFEPEALESRLRVVRKIAAALEDEGRLDRYRAALAESARLIAADAAADHPQLANRAEATAESFLTPSASIRSAVSSRVEGVRRRGRRLARRIVGTRADTAADGRPSTDVRYGLDLATRCIDAGADHEPPPVERITRPQVSVVIPTYNRASAVRRAIDSVLAQSYDDLEVLVVDDGSTDDTAAVVGGYTDPRLRYLPLPENRGVAVARNHGMRMARGEFIAFLDSDDVWLEDKLARQVPRLVDSPPAVGFVYGGVETYGDAERRIELPSHTGDVRQDLLLRNVLHGASSSALMRRDVVATVGYFDEDLPAIEDYDYWLRVSRFFELDAVDQPVVRYIDFRDESRKSWDTDANLRARAQFFEKHEREMRRAGTAHRFALESARRHLRSHDPAGARRPALLCIRHAPTHAPGYGVLLRTLAPEPLRELKRALTRRTETSPADASTQMRVMMYSTTSPSVRGGVQAVYLRLAAVLRQRGHVVIESWAETPPHDLPPASVQPLHVFLMRGSTPLPRSLLESGRSLWGLAIAMARHRPQVVNVHFVRYELLHFVLLRPLFGYKLVASTHGSDVMRAVGWLDRNLLPRLLASADAVTTVSPALATRILESGRVDAEKLRIIPNGIDHEFWSGLAGPELAHRDPVVLSVGRLHHLKGHDTLIEAFRYVTEVVPDAALLIVGDGEARQALEQRVEEMGLRDSVQLIGQAGAEEIRKLMSESRIFALPSRSEGMPLALLEAMSAGLPAVATAVGGVPGLVEPETGILVPPEQPEVLGRAIADLLVDTQLATKMGHAAREKGRLFDAATADQAYEELFAELLGHR